MGKGTHEMKLTIFGRLRGISDEVFSRKLAIPHLHPFNSMDWMYRKRSNKFHMMIVMMMMD